MSRSTLWRERVLPMVVAVAAVFAVIPVKMALNAAVERDIGFIPSVAAVVIAAWVGGFLPGITATVVAMLLEAFVFIEPKGQLAVAAESDRIRLALFGLIGLLTSWLAWLRSQAEQRARVSASEATAARDRADLTARRLGALQGLSAQLSIATTSDQMLEAGLERGMEALRADGGVVHRIEPETGGPVAVAWRGYRDEEVAPLRHPEPGLALPATDVARLGEPVFLEDPEAFARAYRSGGPGAGRATEPPAVAAVAIQTEGRRLGVLTFTWDHPHELPPDRRAVIVSLARLVAGGIERSQLLDGERATRARLALLAEAGRVLGASLDYEAILRRLAGLALPLLGDLTIVDVLEEAGVRRLVATARPELAEAAAVIERHPMELAGSGPLESVLRSGTPGTFVVDEATIGSAARSPDHADALRQLGARWALVTPLRALGRTTGVIAFLRRAGGPYQPADVEFATELGERAGRALENARLHTQVEHLAERERRRAGELEAVVASIGEGILVTDPGGAITSSNVAATRLLGGPVTTLDELLSRLLDTNGEPPCALGSGPAEYRLGARPTAWVEISAYPVAGTGDLHSPSTVVVCRDVSAFRQGQALREAFLGLLSHELRTPVTTIYGGSAVLARQDSSLDRATRDEILSDIAGEADRLYRLVEDLLVLARFDEGMQIGSEPALLQRLVPAVVQQERNRWPATAFSVDARSDLPAVGGDETSISQVVRNLLSNAAKYSGIDGSVSVVIEPAEEGVAVRVQDDGPGIDPAEAEDLFSPFYRSPSTAKMAGGAGIGLYVSRRLVDAMGGRIWAAPRAGRGSEFCFVLPVYRGLPDD